MVPKAVSDAGYTAVGLGVLALQQVQTRRREIAGTLGTVLTGVKTMTRPVTRRLEDLPCLPGPLGQLVGIGRGRLCSALRP